MVSVTVRSRSGDQRGALDLDPALFDIEPNLAVMHQVVTAQLAAARRGTHSTKSRAEVAGGGHKPWRQKGTGRARHGSIRAPQWSGGGIAMGPKPRSYRQRTPKKMVQLALRSALSDRARAGRVAVVDGWDLAAPRTRDAKTALAELGIEGSVLVVLERNDEVAYRSFRNLADVQLILVDELNTYDVLCNDWLVFTRSTLPGRAAEPAGASGADPGEEPAPGVLRPDPVETESSSYASPEHPIPGSDDPGSVTGAASGDVT
jgi:large subunit ribosomal protein L4